MPFAFPLAVVPRPIRQFLRGRFEFMADPRRNPGLALSQLPLAGELIAAAAPVRQPPVLLTSLPRSGSSWIGRILGSADEALYLREPLTQAYLKRIGHRGTPLRVGHVRRPARL